MQIRISYLLRRDANSWPLTQESLPITTWPGLLFESPFFVSHSSSLEASFRGSSSDGAKSRKSFRLLFAVIVLISIPTSSGSSGFRFEQRWSWWINSLATAVAAATEAKIRKVRVEPRLLMAKPPAKPPSPRPESFKKFKLSNHETHLDFCKKLLQRTFKNRSIWSHCL